MIDAIASVMMLEEKELCKTGELAIAVMRETASLIIGDVYKVRLVYLNIHSAMLPMSYRCFEGGEVEKAYVKGKAR